VNGFYVASQVAFVREWLSAYRAVKELLVHVRSKVVEEFIEVSKNVTAGLSSNADKISTHDYFVPRLEVGLTLQIKEKET
jgi:hypothetical protein